MLLCILRKMEVNYLSVLKARLPHLSVSLYTCFIETQRILWHSKCLNSLFRSLVELIITSALYIRYTISTIFLVCALKCVE